VAFGVGLYFMKLRKFVIPQCAFILLGLIAFGQTTSGLKNPPTIIPTKLLQGVVVEEEAGKNSETGKSKFQKGDILLRWSGNDVKGEIVSPFDLRELLIEQTPRGTVRIDGLRGDETQTWILEQNILPIRSRPNFPESLLAIYREGQQLAQSGKLVQAAERWRAAAMQAHEPDSPWLGAWLLSNAAELLAGARQWQQADDLYREAIEQTDGVGPNITADLLEDWAKTFDDRRDWVHAEKYHQQALAVRMKFGTEITVMASVTLNGLGLGSWRRGELARAEEYYSQALAIQEKLAPGSLYVAGSLVDLGGLSDRQGDLVKAEEYYRRALAISSGRRNFQAAILNNLGNIAHNRGDFATAERYYRQVVGMGQDSYNLVIPLSNLGAIARDRGDLARAEEYYRKALTVQEKRAADDIETARILTKLGDVVGNQGRLAKGEDYQRQALAITEKLAPGSHDVARVLSNLGSVTAKRGDLIKAETYYRQALEIYETRSLKNPQVAVVLNRLGDLLHERGDLTKADEYYRQALAIWEKMAPGSKDHAETLAALAELMRQKQRLDAAAQLYQQALNALESQTARLGGADEDRFRFRAKYVNYYKDYADLLIAQRRPELAFEVLELSRARSLLEMLAAGKVNIRQGVDATLLAREHSLRDSITAKSNRRIALLSGKQTEEPIAGLDQEIKELLAQLDEVEAQIRLNSPAYAALMQPQPLSLKEIQEKLLDQDTLLLEYSLGEEHSYLFVVSSTSLAVHELPKRSTIERTVQRAYELLTQRNNQNAEAQASLVEQEYMKAAAQLSRMLLAPAAAQLRGNRLLIVSEGVLHYVPFAALPSPGNFSLPLIVRHEIVSLPSASVLAVLRQEAMGRKLAPRTVAVLADPVFDQQDVRVKGAAANQGRVKNLQLTRGAGEEQTEEGVEADSLTRSVADMGVAAGGAGYLPRLQLTRQEARKSLRVTRQGEGMQALDFKASRATVMSPTLAQYRIVHFATHGLLNSKHPELSGLVLSLVDEQGRPQNGFLGLQDIYNLNLPAELVVLSACETGLGKSIQGEGLVGLTRGFMYAGATRVVASLWKIDDLATAELMAEFYKAMERDGMRPAAALRAAQIHMWKQQRWRSPYYWAAFQIHGEWK